MAKPKRAARKKPPASGRWQNRIVGHAEVAPGDLLANPRNWRVHPKLQGDALRGILAEVGWVQDVVVNRRTGHIVDGHLRVSLAIQQGEQAIPVKYIDVSEEEEALLLATLDPLGALASTDGDALDALLQTVQSDDGGIASLLAELSADADASRLTSPNGAGRGYGSGDKAKQIRAVLYAHEIGPFERAIQLTGLTNRGHALIAICEDYLARHGQEG